MRRPTLRYILKLMEKKYPGQTVLLIYDDESGRIVKSLLNDIYEENNVWFAFSTMEELVAHLEEE
jgi:hypothetical protein